MIARMIMMSSMIMLLAMAIYDLPGWVEIHTSMGVYRRSFWHDLREWRKQRKEHDHV